MNRTPVPEADFCWLCRHLQCECFKECPGRLPPNEPNLIGNVRRPRSKNDLHAQQNQFKHGQETLRQWGHCSTPARPFSISASPPPLSLPPTRMPLATPCQEIPMSISSFPPIPPLLLQTRDRSLQLSSRKRKRNEMGKDVETNNLGVRPAKAAAATEVQVIKITNPNALDVQGDEAAQGGANVDDRQDGNQDNDDGQGSK